MAQNILQNFRSLTSPVAAGYRQKGDPGEGAIRTIAGGRAGRG